MQFEFLETLERFQTIIVGALGFIGVTWTLRANAKMSQHAHNRELDAKRTALRRLLAAEFRSFVHALNENLKIEPQNTETLSVSQSMRIITKDITTELGLLSPGEIDVVANAIISLEGMSQYLEHIATHKSEKRYFIPQIAWSEYCRVASRTVDALKLALKMLDEEFPH